MTQRLEIAEVTNPGVHHGNDQVFFGATVTYGDQEGRERTVTILGVDEAISTLGQISWISPVAHALLKAQVGHEVRLVTPHGVELLEILKVDYPRPDASLA